MKNCLLLFLAMVLLASCSAPKYAYHFDHYDYNSGKKEKAIYSETTLVVETESVSPIASIDEQALVASASESSVYVPEVNESALTLDKAKENYTALSRTEKKEIRKEAVKSIKEYVKAKKNGDNDKAEQLAKAMDNDLKLAAIFGAVGIVAAIIGGDVFLVISAVAWIIAVIFFIKWLVRQ